MWAKKAYFIWTSFRSSHRLLEFSKYNKISSPSQKRRVKEKNPSYTSDDVSLSKSASIDLVVN